MRRGASLVELLVALVITAVVLAVATGSLLRQQRTSRALSVIGAANAQLRAGTSLLPAQLALLSPATSDLAVGQIRDTALQFRSAIATGVSCDSGAAVVFAIEQDSLWTSGVASTPHGSDSLWWYDGDSARWNGRLVVGARTDSARCGPGRSGSAGQKSVMHVDLAGSDVVQAFAPLRITRQTRIAVYRASDGTWQLGYREWNDVTATFAAPQPVAGPFARTAADGARTGFRYFDVTDIELHPEVDASVRSRIARIRFTALLLPSQGPLGIIRPPQRDSADVMLRVGVEH